MQLNSLSLKVIIGTIYLTIISIGLYFLFSTIDIKDLMSYEFIRINKEAVAAICLGYPAFNRKRIGLKKIPPPIPTIPDNKPNTDPIKIE